MSDITATERRILEKFLRMEGGYVLNFSDRTFSEFFGEYQIDIDNEKYKENGTSKANRLRTFLKKEPNYIVGNILKGLIEYAKEKGCLLDDITLLNEFQKVSQRLVSSQPIAELSSLTTVANEHNIGVIEKIIKDTIDKNQPEIGLDRLHTFITKYIRILCNQYGIDTDKEKPLQSLFGEYVKKLRELNHLETVMAERILKSMISVFEAFNDVRNNRSLAHDNSILNYEESLLIFNYVSSSIRFINALEDKIKTAEILIKHEDEIPF